MPWTQASRFVLFDNGRFVLQFVDSGAEYHGVYYATDDILFDFGNTFGRATGSIDGDLLIVRYNTIMHLSDFEDATYMLR